VRLLNSAFVFLLASSASWAVTLRESESVSIEAGTEYERDLSDQVTHKTTSDIEYTLVEAPGWLRLKGDTLIGTPPTKDLGPIVITFRARENKLSVPAVDGRLVLNVFVTPTLPADFDIGEVEERKKIEVSLRAKTRHPDLGTVAFRVHPKDEIPAWLKLSADGILSGTPDRSQIGKRVDFRVWVTSNYGGKAEARIRGRVKKVPLASHWKKKEFEMPVAKEDGNYLYEIDAANMVDNPEAARPRFRIADNSSAWGELSWDGKFRGIPRRKDIGKKSWDVELQTEVDGIVFKDIARFSVTTEKINKPPQWKQEIVQLPRATSNQKYEYKDLASQVVDPDGDKLQFEIVPGSGPNWLSIGTDGILRAAIQPQFTGGHRWKVTVSDGKMSDTARLELAVDNHAPTWKATPSLTEAPQSAPYAFDLKTIADDIDKDALVFEARRLPKFLQLEGSRLVGTPERESVGSHPVRLRVTDGQASADLETEIKVTLKAYPPEAHVAELRFKMKERSQLSIALNNPKYVSDPNNDTLKFRWADKAPNWAVLNENGTLTLSPQLPQVGIQNLPLVVSDSKFNVPLNVPIEVQRDPRPSEWAKDPIAFRSRAREGFTGSVGKQVRDLDSMPVRFAKRSGPSWLSVAPTGELTGTPPDSAVGKNTFVLVADNGLVPAEKIVEIDVEFKNHPPEVMAEALVLELKERLPVTLDLMQARYTRDADEKDTRVFALEKPSDWISLSPSGALTLNPAFKQIGKHSIGFLVSDGKDKTRGQLELNVSRDPRPPQWEKEEFTVEALTRENFRLDLNKHVKDLDGLRVVFGKRSGSDLFSVSAEGIVSGQPKDEQAGEYVLKIQAQNDLKASTARVTVKVSFKNTPPQWKQNQIELGRGRANTIYSQDFSQHADDIDKFQKLKFSKVSGPGWIVIDPAGKVFGQPTPADQGRNTVQVRVDDGAGGSAVANVSLQIEGANSAPTASGGNNNIHLPTAYQGELFLFHLAPLFRDAQGDKLTFRKIFAPNWMRVSNTGEVTGVPGKETFGQYQAIFEVHDGNVGTQIKAQGLVKQP
jgi:hypothetical protein